MPIPKISKEKEAIRRGGPEKLHVLADFDRTLTYALVDGQRRDSLMAILRDEKYLTPDYPAKAHALRDQYYPIEIDFSIIRRGLISTVMKLPNLVD